MLLLLLALLSVIACVLGVAVYSRVFSVLTLLAATATCLIAEFRKPAHSAGDCSSLQGVSHYDLLQARPVA